MPALFRKKESCCDHKAPFLLFNGTRFDVIDYRLRRANRGAVRIVCEFEVLRDDQEVFIEIWARFYETCFTRGMLPENPDCIIEVARRMVWEYLNKNRQKRAVTRCNRRVMLSFR